MPRRVEGDHEWLIGMESQWPPAYDILRTALCQRVYWAYWLSKEEKTCPQRPPKKADGVYFLMPGGQNASPGYCRLAAGPKRNSG
jgi:hypothetical protein